MTTTLSPSTTARVVKISHDLADLDANECDTLASILSQRAVCRGVEFTYAAAYEAFINAPVAVWSPLPWRTNYDKIRNATRRLVIDGDYSPNQVKHSMFIIALGHLDYTTALLAVETGLAEALEISRALLTV
jgi:hypothetical protein